MIRKNRSPVWDYFEKSSDASFVTCQICFKTLKYFGNTTNLRSHLDRLHPNVCSVSELRIKPEVSEGSSSRSWLKDESAIELCPDTELTTSSALRARRLSQATASSGGTQVCVGKLAKKPRQLMLCVSTCHKNLSEAEWVDNELTVETSCDLEADASAVKRSQLSSQETASTCVTELGPCEPAKKARVMMQNAPTYQKNLSEAERSDIDYLLVDMISKDLLPLTIVENEGFTKYSKKLEPRYTLPSREVLSTKLIPDVYTNIRRRVITMINSVRHVSISTELWTSNDALSYMTVTVHFVTEVSENSLQSLVLRTVPITDRQEGENIASSLDEILREWNVLRKTVAIVTNNSANIKRAVEILKKPHLSCVAHTLNSVVNDTLKETDLARILQKCRVLASYFKTSSVAADKLRNMQRQMGAAELKLKRDVSAKWCSSLLMLECLLALKEPLSETISSLSIAPENLEAYEWDAVAECITLLKPIEIMTTALLGKKYPTVSVIIPLVQGIQLAIKRKQPHSAVAQKLQSSLLLEFLKLLGTVETNEMISKATILDARFKKQGFGLDENANKAEEELYEELAGLMKKSEGTEQLMSSVGSKMIGQTTATSEEDSVWYFLDSKIGATKSSTRANSSAAMLQQYLGLPHLDRSDSLVQFWFSQKSNMPELHSLALKYLCVPATSVPSERVFSKAGQLLSCRRSMLLPKTVDQLVFLNFNQ